MKGNFLFMFNLFLDWEKVIGRKEIHPESADKQRPAWLSLTSAAETSQEVGS